MNSTGPWGPPRSGSTATWSTGSAGSGPWPSSQPGWQAPNPLASSWPTPSTTAGRPAKKGNSLGRVIIVAVVLLVIAPTVSSWLNQLNQTPPAGVVIAPSTSSAPINSASQTAPISSSSSTPDLNPDEPPMPQTYAEVDTMLETNPLYAQHLLPTACSMANIDLTAATVPSIEQHLNIFVDCLMASWRPPVIGAGFTLPHPSVTVYTRETTSACGTLPMENAVYCSADQQIYFARDLIDAFPRNYQTMRFMAEAVLAHEFGHTVQYRTMILISETVLQNDAKTKSAGNDLSRRLEMQADCFAGLFFNSVSTSTGLTDNDRQNIIGLFTTLGGATAYTDDHGTGQNRGHWLNQGLMSTTPGDCSTFTAPASSVG